MLKKADSAFVAGNYFDKYRSGNPLHRRLLKGFLDTAVDLIRDLPAETILEAGAGPGDLAAHILPAAGHAPRRYLGTDVSSEQVALARVTHPEYRFEPASIYDLPADDKSIDLVIACEVLEHLDTPERAIDELYRVCRGKLLLSVPNEPLWCMLNMVRGKYWSRLGNTPGHLQNFTPRAIRQLCETRFVVEELRQPLPWTMMLLSPEPIPAGTLQTGELHGVGA